MLSIILCQAGFQKGEIILKNKGPLGHVASCLLKTYCNCIYLEWDSVSCTLLYQEQKTKWHSCLNWHSYLKFQTFDYSNSVQFCSFFLLDRWRVYPTVIQIGVVLASVAEHISGSNISDFWGFGRISQHSRLIYMDIAVRCGKHSPGL